MENRVTEIPEVEGLTFDDDHHIYRLDGMEVPSVSAIMEPLNNAKYARIDSKTLNRAANKGTIVHNAIENWIKFGIEDIPTAYAGYFHAYQDWYAEHMPEIIGSEVRLYNKLMGYGGTADIVAYIDDELTLIDTKTTYAISDMTCGVQLEAYAQALKSMGVDIQRKFILQIKKDGRYVYREYPAHDAMRWTVFGSLKNVYDYIKTA